MQALHAISRPAPLRAASLFALALLVFTAASVGPASAEQATTCPHWIPGLLSGETFNGADGTVYASTLWDPDGGGSAPERLVLGGSFLSVQFSQTGRVAVRNPGTTYWDGVTFNEIGYVKSLGTFQNDLIIGGQNIYRWNGASLVVMGAGIASGEVKSITVFDGQLYIGGTFTLVGGGQYFARWNGSGWEVPFGAPNGEVRAMQQYGNALVVAGLFSSVGSPSFAVANIARFDGQWSSMGTGLDNVVSCLQAYGGFMYAGGSFTHAGAVTTGGFARWNGTSWSAVGGNFLGSVFSLSVYSNLLVIGGQYPGLNAPNLAFYNGTSYSTIGGVGTNAPVFTTIAAEGYLYVGGGFDYVGAVPARFLARWNGASWLPVGGGSANQVRAFQPYAGRLVAGGDFVESIDPYPAAFDVASWNGLVLTNFGTGTNGVVTALEAFNYGPLGSQELLAGGTFTAAGGVGANRIARWNEDPFSPFPPPAWQAMGAGFNDVVYAIKRYNGVTYAAGSFTASGATGLAHIAKWNETTDVWEPVGSGLNGTVYALEVYNGVLYAGGSFTNAGAVSTGGFARWNGSSWSNIGGFFLGTVYALEVYSGNLVMAGQFNGFGGSPNLSSTNGSSYANFGVGGADGPIYALAVHEGNLVIGGEFGFAGNQPARRLAKWNGTSWSEIEGGTDDTIYALASFQGELHVGGWFSEVGGFHMSPRWDRYSTTGIPMFVRQPSSVTVNPGGSASFTAEPVETFYSEQSRWYRGNDPLSDGPTGTGSSISGATLKTVSVQNVSVADAGVYQRRVTNACGEYASNAASLSLNVVGVGDDAPPLVTAFERVAPNPARGGTVATYALAQPARVTIGVYDVAGRALARIERGILPAGVHSWAWDGRSGDGRAARPGLYFVRLEADGRAVGTKKLVLAP
jgi:hypothetical protein